MARERRYTDDELTSAVSQACSWRGVLRELGLSGTSSRSIASVRAHADRLSLDYGHFQNQFRWREAELRAALSSARAWSEALDLLDLQVGSLDRLKGHAARFGIDVAHLDEIAPPPRRAEDRPDASNLRRAGPLLAASWFMLCGYEVSWPLEPARYDLLVDNHESIRRVQVKTTTVRTLESWKVYLSSAGEHRRTYTPDEIDDFFVIDGSLTGYLIPYTAVGGLQAVHLSAYDDFRLTSFFIPRSPHERRGRRSGDG